MLRFSIAASNWQNQSSLQWLYLILIFTEKALFSAAVTHSRHVIKLHTCIYKYYSLSNMLSAIQKQFSTRTSTEFVKYFQNISSTFEFSIALWILRFQYPGFQYMIHNKIIYEFMYDYVEIAFFPCTAVSLSITQLHNVVLKP